MECLRLKILTGVKIDKRRLEEESTELVKTGAEAEEELERTEDSDFNMLAVLRCLGNGFLILVSIGFLGLVV